MKKIGIPILIGLVLIFCTRVMAEEIKLPPMPPTIEELTGGKVKIGDVITKDNVDLVKDYLSPALYECVKKGMVLRMAENYPPEIVVPAFFSELTLKNKGKAVIDENGTVYLKDGSIWPGGLPFPEPRTGLEAMANFKFGFFMDDWVVYQLTRYVNKKGKVYKTNNMEITYSQPTVRLKIPPLGVAPGFEKERLRQVAVFTGPLEIKGLGQLIIRHYEEIKYPDNGFAYLPAFKRVIRVSATTYQDNMGGSDFTWADPQGVHDPFAYWEFKIINQKFMLSPCLAGPTPTKKPDGSYNYFIEYDQGDKFPRRAFSIVPMCIVEAKPKIEYLYGKRVLYLPEGLYWNHFNHIMMADVYDRQMKMWKMYLDIRGATYAHKGIEYHLGDGMMMHDIQSDHTTQFWYTLDLLKGTHPGELNLKTLLLKGR